MYIVAGRNYFVLLNITCQRIGIHQSGVIEAFGVIGLVAVGAGSLGVVIVRYDGGNFATRSRCLQILRKDGLKLDHVEGVILITNFVIRRNLNILGLTVFFPETGTGTGCVCIEVVHVTGNHMVTTLGDLTLIAGHLLPGIGVTGLVVEHQAVRIVLQ